MSTVESRSPSAVQIRTINADTVYAAMRGVGEVTATDLIAGTGLSRPTVHAACDWLIAQGLVQELPALPTSVSQQPGRPARRYAVVPRAGHVVALEIRESYVGVAIADLLGAVLLERSVRIEPDASLESQAAVHGPGLVREAVGALALDESQVWQVCVSVPAPVQTSVTGQLETQQYRDSTRRLVEAMRESLPWPLVAENDANLAMLAEQRLGAARGAANAVLIDICQNGFGAGLIVNGALVRGNHGIAGEMSAVDLLDGMGPRGGALSKLVVLARERIERGAVDGPLRRRAVEAGGEVDADLVLSAAEDGDPDALAAVDDVGAVIARPVGMVATLLDPELVVLYGLPDRAATLLQPAIERHAARLFEGQLHGPVPRIVRSDLEGRGTLLGAVRRAVIEIERRLFGVPLVARGDVIR